MAGKSRSKTEFGDFQTPPDLAARVCSLVARQGVHPASVVEPTCGRGSFLAAALERFSETTHALGVDLSASHVRAARAAVEKLLPAARVRVLRGNFFTVDWPSLLDPLPDPLLVLGNPPWVTSADLGAMGSDNLPEKSNFQGLDGLDALTGKSNFDVSEWMLIRILELIRDREAAMAVLCKTAVARKVLAHCWRRGIPVHARIHRIDAGLHFGAVVEACLLYCRTGRSGRARDCRVHASLEARTPSSAFGFRDGRLLADVHLHQKWKHLETRNRELRWRSGIKHDCKKVMVLRREEGGFVNGLGERVDLEDDYLFPMLRGSDLAKASMPPPSHWMLVTQRTLGQDTESIRKAAPRTWAYLVRHGQRLDGRASSIYRNRPRFSVFGVGDYAFKPWKVAIPGLYSTLDFVVLGPRAGKSVVLDDTCYFLPCRSRKEAEHRASLLNSRPAQEFFKALLFPDAKRPVTREVLARLDLEAVERAGVTA